MRIGYPCINRTLECRSNRTFRLKSYSDERLKETVKNNLDCLSKILEFNAENNVLFFRITSDLVPFASHPVCRFPWQSHFEEKFKDVGDFVKSQGMRVSTHPGQYTVLNSRDMGVFERSVGELFYHCEVLDLMGLDLSAKVQIHVGGVYKDRELSRERFAERFCKLDDLIKRRLVIENDEKSYSLEDCLWVSDQTGVPVVFDLLHHRLKNNGESLKEAFEGFIPTWKERDGTPIVDYSTQDMGKRPGKHAESIDPLDFQEFLEATRQFDFDVMMEIKDKERSALRAIELASENVRFRG